MVSLESIVTSIKYVDDLDRQRIRLTAGPILSTWFNVFSYIVQVPLQVPREKTIPPPEFQKPLPPTPLQKEIQMSPAPRKCLITSNQTIVDI